MYTILSYIPTAVLPSSPNFTCYVKANIFEPLGLNSTTYSFDVANATGNLADGFFKQQTNFPASPFDVGIPRAIPFWAQIWGEDGDRGFPECFALIYYKSLVVSGAGGVISNAIDMVSGHIEASMNPGDVFSNDRHPGFKHYSLEGETQRLTR